MSVEQNSRIKDGNSTGHTGAISVQEPPTGDEQFLFLWENTG